LLFNPKATAEEAALLRTLAPVFFGKRSQAFEIVLSVSCSTYFKFPIAPFANPSIRSMLVVIL